MRVRWLFVAAIVCVVVVSLFGATSLLASPRRVKASGSLAAQVTVLQKKVKFLLLQDMQYNSQILALESKDSDLQNRTLQVTTVPGLPVTAGSRAWAQATAGPCIGGVLIGGGYYSDYSAYAGENEMNGGGGIGSTWSVHLYDPGSSQMMVTPQAICLSLSP